MEQVYLSPHFDDAALSCGGLIWEQALTGETAQVWTVCAGKPPGELSPFAQALHARWGTGVEAVDQRRNEDIASCRVMGAQFRHYPIPDCIYRQDPQGKEFLYASEEAIFGRLHPAEAPLIGWLSDRLSRDFTGLRSQPAMLVCPLALGNHVDHELTRSAAEATGIPLYYYEDYPYVLKEEALTERLRKSRFEDVVFPVSEAGLRAWQQAIAAHGSQASTFWPDLSSMEEAVRYYLEVNGGVRLWHVK
ncbi:MAG: PIG-L deacetylase family protein [Omnitrophica WOR_2 bacterium]